MVPHHDHSLSARERQIMDVVTELGDATVRQVADRLPDPPTTTAVRTMLGILVSKGALRASRRGRAMVYTPTVSRDRAGRRAIRETLKVFFGGSLEKAVSTYLTDPAASYSDAELEELERLVREIKQRRRAGGGDREDPARAVRE